MCAEGAQLHACLYAGHAELKQLSSSNGRHVWPSAQAVCCAPACVSSCSQLRAQVKHIRDLLTGCNVAALEGTTHGRLQHQGRATCLHVRSASGTLAACLPTAAAWRPWAFCLHLGIAVGCTHACCPCLLQDEVLAHRLGLVPLQVDPELFDWKTGESSPDQHALVATLQHGGMIRIIARSRID